MAHGQWQLDDTAPDARGVLVSVPEELVDAAGPQCESLQGVEPANCRPVPQGDPADDGTVLIGTTAGEYHPGFYWVVGTAADAFSGAASLYAMRVAAALLCALFFGIAVWSLLAAARPRGCGWPCWPG